MLITLRLQLKNILRDKFVQISILLPIVLAIVLKLCTPNLIIEPRVAILKDNLSPATINQLADVAIVEQYFHISELRNRILENKNEIIGLVFDDRTGHFKVMLQGNETIRVKTTAQIIAKLINGRITTDKTETEILINDNNDLYNFLMTLNVLIALFMGCTFNAFNLVAEKEEGIININRILPIQHHKYIIQKTILGFIGSVVVAVVTITIAFGSGINWWIVFPFILVSSFAVSILGLYLGLFSNGLLSIIVNTKVILLLFIFVPVIGFIMPADLKVMRTIFYLIPSFPMFAGLWAIFQERNMLQMIINTSIMGIQALLAYFIYLNMLKKAK